MEKDEQENQSSKMQQFIKVYSSEIQSSVLKLVQSHRVQSSKVRTNKVRFRKLKLVQSNKVESS